MNSWEFYSRIEMFKHTQKDAQKDDELAHYGITGQKWGRRRWQNADGTFNAEGKERYFGSKSSSSSDDKMGGARSNVKDYLKFRNKMLKKHAKADMDKWYIEEHKEDDKKLLKDAKRIDKSAKKMYENQLKDYYDNPNDLVDDLNKVYKFGGKNKGNSNNVDEIYKKHKPNEWRSVLNNSDLSTEDKIKLENELNKKLYKEDKHYANIVNNEDVKNALKEYIDVRNDVIKESNRIFSKEFMDNNPEAKNWDGDGTEYWHKFADKDIANKDIESYWKLRETVSSLSRKHGSWNNEIFDKVMSDLTEPVEDITDDSSKAYDKIKEHIGVDFRELSPKEEKALQKEADKIDKDIIKNKMSIRDFIDSDKCNDIKNMATELVNKNCMDELKDLTDVFKDYKYHNYDYSALAGITNALEHPYFGKNMGDISNAIVGYVYDDFDQGYGNSAAIYLYDKGYTADQISKISERNLNNRDNVKNAISISIEKDPLLSKLNKANKIRIRNWIEDDASYMLTNDEDRRNKEGDRYSYDTYSMWVGNADDGIQSNKSEKSDKYLPEAKKIFNKVSKTCNSVNDGWWYLNQAINELGYSDINYKDLTDSDWNKINAKIRELG